MPEECLERARRGDRAARAQLYQLVAGPAYTLARRLVGRTAAEDVFQDSMMLMFERLEQFRAATIFGRWLRRIVVTQALMHLRSPWQRARSWLEAGDDDWDRQTNAKSDPACSWDAERLLAKLPRPARIVLWLYVAEGYTHEQIAAAFGRSPSFSKSQVARALERLRASAGLLQQDGSWNPRPRRIG